MIRLRFDLRHPAVGLGVAVCVLLISLYSNAMMRARVRDDGVALDSLRHYLTRELQLAQTALQPGDTLPEVALLAPSGDTVSLRSLPNRGIRYVYLFREDCPACRILEPFMASVSPAKLDSIAFVAYHPTMVLGPAEGRRHFSWIHPARAGSDSTYEEKRFFRGVPTLLVLGHDGRIASPATGLFAVRNTLDLYAVSDGAAISAAYRLAVANSRVAPPRP